MADITFEHIRDLAERLSPSEQQLLIEHLQRVVRQRQLSLDEKKALLESLEWKTDTLPPDFSFRRADWYEDYSF